MVAVFLFGTLGYYSLGAGQWSLLDCIYMTAVTLSTVGYREIVPVTSPDLQVFTIFLLVAGVGSLLYFTSTFMSFIVEGDLGQLMERKRMDKRLAKTTNHVIVCGCGRIGSETAFHLHKAGYGLVLVDQDEDKLRHVREELSLDVPYVVGNSTDEVVLLHAGIQRAQGLVCAVDSDHENLYTVVTAKDLNPFIRIVARVSNKRVGKKFLKTGADSVVAPSEIGGQRLFFELTQPTVTSFMEAIMLPEKLNLSVREIEIKTSAPLAGKSLGEANLRRTVGNVLILAMRDPVTDSYRYNPMHTCRFEPGLHVIAMGTKEELDKLEEVMGR